ncbi:MAG: transporter [Candidatus Omnitrophica bacterium]|nr:transporter [Candidatus Omnitrophota bacterium]
MIPSHRVHRGTPREARPSGTYPLIGLVVISLVLLGIPIPVGAVAINSDVGLTPYKGQVIVRSQVRYTSKRDDPTDQDRNNWVLAMPQALVYGFTESFAGILTVPYLHKELRSTSAGERVVRQDAGIGDITLLAKGRVYTRDFPGATSRLSLLGGLELPTGESGDADARGKLPRTLQLGSGSWDPIVGATYTWQSLDDEWDVSLTYQFNTTANKLEFGDVVQHTVAYQKRVLPWRLPERGEYTLLNVVLEANGVWAQKNVSGGSRVDNSGGYTLFLSPGLQVASKYAVAEISVQLPALQTLNGNQVETDVVVAGSVRFTF